MKGTEACAGNTGSRLRTKERNTLLPCRVAPTKQSAYEHAESHLPKPNPTCQAGLVAPPNRCQRLQTKAAGADERVLSSYGGEHPIAPARLPDYSFITSAPATGDADTKQTMYRDTKNETKQIVCAIDILCGFGRWRGIGIRQI
jgi:hypothetical protein